MTGNDMILRPARTTRLRVFDTPFRHWRTQEGSPDMRTHSCHSRLLACLAAMAVMAPVSTAVAQSDRDLRDENQRLTTEVKSLKRWSG